jgi:uncharacterized protein (DUF2235 family)
LGGPVEAPHEVNGIATNAKNVVLLSDGTGNAASRVWRTNVWRLFQSLDLTNSRQVALYDDGVGSSSFTPLALIGGIFGWGLKRNVLELYRFLCRNYEDGARIYAFGFSRGAFTIRVLLGLVAHQGIVRYESEGELRRRSVAAYRAYRKERFHSVLRVETLFRALRDGILRLAGRRYDRTDNMSPPPIRFAGVWDTVAAYGLPIEEMTRGVSQWLWPLELPNRKLSPIVRRACHALALDDERTTFHPVLWSEREEAAAPADWQERRWTRDERLSQVWFSGSHSNVGGGYPDDSLAHVSLTWIMKEAELCGLRFKAAPEADPDAAATARSSADKDGRLYDSRHALGGYYRYGPRKIYDLCHRRASRREDDEVTIDVPKVHESAIDRAANGAHAYAPIGLPARYAVVLRNGEIVEGPRNPFETPEQAQARAAVQERVWDLVWWRRVVYFATLGASAYLLLFPLLRQTVRAHEFSTPLRIVSDGVRLLGAFLPAFAGWWLDAFAANPGRFLAALLALVACMTAGVMLGSAINGAMHSLWRTILWRRATPAGGLPTGLVYRLRTHSAYRGLHWAMKRHVIPLVSAVLLLYLGAAVVSHVVFDIADAAGSFCREGTRGPFENVQTAPGREVTVQGFAADSMCWPTGIELVEGRRYRITITQAQGWRDRASAVDLSGFEIGELPHVGTRLRLFAGLPLRRVLNRPWFRPIARIGAVGADEYPLDPDTRPVAARVVTTADEPDELIAEIRARRTGELFVYVNDGVLGLPRLANTFYANNGGQAQVQVTQLSRR